MFRHLLSPLVRSTGLIARSARHRRGNARIGNRGLFLEPMEQRRVLACGGGLDFPGADVTADQQVDLHDFAEIKANFASSGDPGIPGDTNADGIVDLEDVNHLRDNFWTSSDEDGPTPTGAMTNALRLTQDANDLNFYIENAGLAAVSFDGYIIADANGRLLESEAEGIGNSFGEANWSACAISEVRMTGSLTLEPGARISVGNPLADIAPDAAEGLSFMFRTGDSVEQGTVTFAEVTPVGPISDVDAAENAISETAVAGTAVGITALAEDANPADTVTYSLDDDADGRFAIDAAGVVTLVGSVDAEAAASHDVVVRATSSDASFSTETFTIAVLDESEFEVSAITDADEAADEVAENSAAGTLVGITALATDGDVSDVVAYSLDDDAEGLFAIDEDGVVTLVGSVDAETAASHDIVVRATSTDGSFSTETFTIAVNDVDEFAISEIVDTDEADDAVAENSPAGTLVGIAVAATDGDVSDVVAYSLDDDANGRFSIDEEGVVTLNGGVDAEFAPSHDIVVRATSTDGSSTTATFTIAVTNVDEFDISEIVDADVAENTVAENSAIGAAVGITASATDADYGVVIAYSMDDDADGLFAIDATTGVVTVAGAIDYEAATSHEITVRATSSDGSTTTAVYTIAVTNVNETGVSEIVDSDAAEDAIAENSAAGSLVGITAAATDSDLGDAVTYNLDDDADGLFAIDEAGVITLVGSVDAETAQSHDVVVRATSSDGSSTTATFTIAVLDVSEFEISTIADADEAADEVTENSVAGTAVGITALATDDDASDVVAYSLDDDADGLFAIDAVSGIVTVAGAIDYETAVSHDIVVRATSTDGSYSTQSFTIVVNNVNETGVSEIVDLDEADDAVAENSAPGTLVGITVSATDGDLGDSVTYSLDDSAAGVVTLNGGVEADFAPCHDIVVRATSTDGSTTIATFTIAIINVNEFPLSAITDADAADNSVAENSDAGTAVGITAAATDPDFGVTVAYSLDDDADGLFAIDAAGVVTLVGSVDAETATSHDIVVRATSSDGSTTTASFTIAVTNVDEFAVSEVVDADEADDAVAENSAAGTVVGITASATDGDLGDTVTYSLDDDAGGLFAIDAAGVVTLVGEVDAETAQSHDVVVRATSTDGSFSTAAFTIAVTNVDEFDIVEVVDVDEAANEVTENSAVGTAVGITASATDADAGVSISYSLDDDAGGLFAIDATTGVVSVAGVIDYEAATSHTIVVRATSTDGSTNVQSFEIAVNDVANPTGDTNADEVVDLEDLNNVRNNFGETGENVLGDTNGDGVVDLDDLNAVRNNFGAGAPQDGFQAGGRAQTKGTLARDAQIDLTSSAVLSRGSQKSDQGSTTDAIFDAWPESSFVANARAKARTAAKSSFRSF